MEKPKRPESKPLLRGLSAQDERRAAVDVLRAIPWDGHARRDTLPATSFLATILG